MIQTIRDLAETCVGLEDAARLAGEQGCWDEVAAYGESLAFLRMREGAAIRRVVEQELRAAFGVTA